MTTKEETISPKALAHPLTEQDEGADSGGATEGWPMQEAAGFSMALGFGIG
jgi:hypothetical protein